MLEREKQRTDQQKKQAGKASDPETMKDKGYIERIEEKTEKH